MSAHDDAAEIDDEFRPADACTEAGPGVDKAAPRGSQRKRRLPVRELDGASHTSACRFACADCDASTQTSGLRMARKMQSGAMRRWTRWIAARRSVQVALLCFMSPRRLKARCGVVFRPGGG